MKDLTLPLLKILIASDAIHRVNIEPYPAIDGGGWTVRVDHNNIMVREPLSTQRGGIRHFKTVDAAVSAVREAGFYGRATIDLKQ